MFKKLLPIFLTVALIFGCAHMPDVDFEMPGEVNWDDVGTELAIRTAAKALGYYIGKSGNADWELLIAQNYEFIKTGQFNVVIINEALNRLAGGDPDAVFLASLLSDVIVTVGGVYVDGQLIQLNIPEKIWDIAEMSYNVGLAMGKVYRI